MFEGDPLEELHGRYVCHFRNSNLCVSYIFLFNLFVSLAKIVSAIGIPNTTMISFLLHGFYGITKGPVK